MAACRRCDVAACQCPLWPLPPSLPPPTHFFFLRLQAKTRKLAERRIPKEELEDLERRRRAEEAEDRKGMVSTMR